MQESIRLFISYAHEDELLKNQLIKHLALLQNQGFVTEWHDRDISAGADWAYEINSHLNTAHVILLLVSADFLASKYCYSIEMKRALERHQAKETSVIPIILRPVDWHEAPFSHLQPLPTEGKPVTSWSGRHGRDSAFTNITVGIRVLVKELRPKSISLNLVSLEKSQNEEQKLTSHVYKHGTLNQSLQSNSIFVFSQPLANPNELYGREYERVNLIETVRQRQCLSITGPLRIGKTWLLQYLMLIAEEEYGSQFFAGYMDATMPNCATPDGFLTQVGELFDIAGSFAKNSPKDNLIQTLTYLAEKGVHPVLCIDEFDACMHEKFASDFFMFLRAIAGRGWLAIITASRRPIYEIERPQPITSPFSGIFRHVELDPFHSKDAEQFIHFKGMQAGLTEQEQMQLLRCTQIDKNQWYPWHLQLAGMMLLEDKNFATQKDQSYYHPNDPTYWQDFEHRLEKQIRMIEGKTYTSQSAVNRKKFTTRDLKNTLDELDNVEFLKNSFLGETNYVLIRQRSANRKKGYIVRDFLTAGFQRLQSNGIRSDLALDWRPYNILYYCYFRYHLSSEEITARLGLTSRRQFYRESDKSLQILLEELLKLEETSLEEG